MLRRSFTHLDTKSFKKLYCTFVRPHLEYAQNIWSPHLLKHIDILEKVQERATKLVDGLKNLNYSERLKKLDMTTLAFRRLRGDVIEIFKHLHTYDKDSLPPTSFRLKTRPSRRHKFQLHAYHGEGKRSILGNFYYHRVAETWNNLPRTVVEAESINSFKNRLDDAWKDHQLKHSYRVTTI